MHTAMTGGRTSFNRFASATSHVALEDLHLDHLYVVYPGNERYALHVGGWTVGSRLRDRIEVIPLSALSEDLGRE
jgi:hypothetical protein